WEIRAGQAGAQPRPVRDSHCGLTKNPRVPSLCRRITLIPMASPPKPLLLLCCMAMARAAHFDRHEIRSLGREKIAGAALDGRRLTTWGDRILSWGLPEGRTEPLRTRLPRTVGPGGALFEIAGEPGVVINEGGGRRALRWVNLRTGKSLEIDHGISANEIL